MKVFLNAILVCAALCTGQFLYAQEPSYVWGEPATNDFPEREIDKLLVLDDQGFVILRKYEAPTTVATYWLEYYSPELNYQTTVALNFSVGVMGDSYFIEDIRVANGKMWAFITHWDKTAGTNELLLRELDLNGELGTPITLATIKAEKMRNSGTYRWNFSKDESVLVVLQEEAAEKKVNGRISVTTYLTDSFEKIDSFPADLSWSSKDTRDVKVFVDKNANTICYFSYSFKPGLSYMVKTCSNAGKWADHSIKLQPDAQIEDFNLSYDNDDEATVYATYTNEPSNFDKKLHGKIFMHFNGKLELVNNDVSAFESQIVSYFMNEKVASDADKSRLEDFYLKDVLVRKDGKMLVLMEKLRYKSNMIAGTSPIQYSYEWHYGNVLVQCIDPKTGELSWWQTFSKGQDLTSNLSQDLYGSFIYHLKEDRLFLIWNNTDLSVPSIPPASWTEPDGTKYVKKKAFDEKTMHGSFLHVIEPDGFLAYEEKKFGLPLFSLHKGAVFEMSITTPFYFELHGDLVVMSAMHNGGKRYRFGFIGF